MREDQVGAPRAVLWNFPVNLKLLQRRRLLDEISRALTSILEAGGLCVVRAWGHVDHMLSTVVGSWGIAIDGNPEACRGHSHWFRCSARQPPGSGGGAGTCACSVCEGQSCMYVGVYLCCEVDNFYCHLTDNTDPMMCLETYQVRGRSRSRF